MTGQAIELHVAVKRHGLGMYERNEWDILVNGEKVGYLYRTSTFRPKMYFAKFYDCPTARLPEGTTCRAAKAIAAELARLPGMLRCTTPSELKVTPDERVC